MIIRVTDLDQLRYYKDSEMSLEELINRLLRKEPPSEKMQAGTAFHAMLETAPAAHLESVVTPDGYTFDLDFDAELHIPAIKEIRGTKEFPGALLVGKVDAIDGVTVYDHKLSGDFDPERYIDALQWRAYLDIFGASRFTYNVFVGDEKEPKHWRVKDFQALTFYRYPGLEADVSRAVAEFVDFSRRHLETV